MSLSTHWSEMVKSVNVITSYSIHYTKLYDVSLQTEELAQLDERVFKFARFIARLTGVDGAVVITEGLELIGFGGIIQGTMEMGESVALALDPEALRRQVELVESVGTRHRSLYYFCHKQRDTLGIVVSQDAKARVV